MTRARQFVVAGLAFVGWRALWDGLFDALGVGSYGLSLVASTCLGVPLVWWLARGPRADAPAGQEAAPLMGWEDHRPPENEKP